jgi:MFS family permease
LGSAVFIPTALAVITDVATPETRGRVMGWYTASAQLGLMAGPAAGGFLLQNFGFEAAFYGCSFMPLLALVFLCTRLNAIHQKPAAVTGHDEHPWNWLRGRGAVVSLATLVLVAVGSGAISTFIPLYVKDFGIAEAGAGIIITACYLSSAALRIPAGTLSDKFGNAPLIVTGLVLSVVGLGLIPLMHSLWPFALAALVFGLGMGFAMPASLTWLAHLSPAAKRGLSMGMGSAAFQVGLALGATTLGVVIDRLGYPVMYFSAAGIMAAGLVIILAAGGNNLFNKA